MHLFIPVSLIAREGVPLFPVKDAVVIVTILGLLRWL